MSPDVEVALLVVAGSTVLGEAGVLGSPVTDLPLPGPDATFLARCAEKTASPSVRMVL
jgi:hypothetical protein